MALRIPTIPPRTTYERDLLGTCSQEPQWVGHSHPDAILKPYHRFPCRPMNFLDSMRNAMLGLLQCAGA
jgi:hypothetical protein